MKIYGILLCFQLLQVINGLTVHPTSQQQYSSTNVTISCHFTLSQCLTDPVWSGPALVSSRFSLTTRQGESNLRIYNVQAHDEGEYHCSCDQRTSIVSNLEILHLPTFLFNVNRNLSFYKGDSAIITCEADHGDPEIPLVWFMNNYQISESNKFRIQRQSLIIFNITEQDTGVYICAFNTPSGLIFRDIAVNVTSRPPTFYFHLSSIFYVTFGNPLNLECSTTPEAQETSWIIDGLKSQSNMLHLGPDEVSTGFYACAAVEGSSNSLHVFRVFVEVIDIPLHLAAPQECSIAAVEGDPLRLTANFRNELDSTDVNLQWTNTITGDSMVVNFLSRFDYNTTPSALTIEIMPTEIGDQGRYSLNISNMHGFDVLTVNIFVIELKRTHLKLKLMNIPCTITEENRQDLVLQVHSEMNCTSCGDVKLALNHSTECLSDNRTTVVSLTLLSQDPLPLPSSIQLSVNGTDINGTFCYSDEECYGSYNASTDGYSPPINAPTDAGYSNKYISIMLPVLLVLLLMIVFVITAVLIVIVKHKRTNDVIPLYDEVGVVLGDNKKRRNDIHNLQDMAPDNHVRVYYDQLNFSKCSHSFAKGKMETSKFEPPADAKLSSSVVEEEERLESANATSDLSNINIAGILNLTNKLQADSTIKQNSTLDKISPASSADVLVLTVHNHNVKINESIPSTVELEAEVICSDVDKILTLEEHAANLPSPGTSVSPMDTGTRNIDNYEQVPADKTLPLPFIDVCQDKGDSDPTRLTTKDTAHATDQYKQICTYERVKYSKSLEKLVADLSSDDVVVIEPEQDDQVTAKPRTNGNEYEQICTYERVKYSKSLENFIAALSFTEVVVSKPEETKEGDSCS